MLRWFATTLAAVLAATAPLAAQSKPRLPEGTRVERDLAYGPHERNKLDVYVPPGDGPFPLVIWVHGGGWQNGSKDGGNPAVPLLRRGYAVASINYRLSHHAVFPAQIRDCQAAVRFLRTNAKKFNVDPARFGAWGASAGGHLVALLGTASDCAEFGGYGVIKDGDDRVQAVCDWFGPTDLARLSPPAVKDNPVAKLLGGDTGTKKDLAAKANPITHVTKDDAPVLILHGDEDRLVPVSQSELFRDALKKAGVECELIVVPGVGHSAQVAAGGNAEKIAAFFDKHLKK